MVYFDRPEVPRLGLDDAQQLRLVGIVDHLVATIRAAEDKKDAELLANYQNNGNSQEQPPAS